MRCTVPAVPASAEEMARAGALVDVREYVAAAWPVPPCNCRLPSQAFTRLPAVHQIGNNPRKPGKQKRPVPIWDESVLPWYHPRVIWVLLCGLTNRNRKAYIRCQIFYLRAEVSLTTTAMAVHLPPRLVEQMDTAVQAGWFSDLDTLIVEALRRYLETHQLESQEHFLRQNVDWACKGRD